MSFPTPALHGAQGEKQEEHKVIFQGYGFMKKFSLTTEEMYGLELANVEVEREPIMVGPVAKVRIKREKEEVARLKEEKYGDFRSR